MQKPQTSMPRVHVTIHCILDWLNNAAWYAFSFDLHYATEQHMEALPQLWYLPKMILLFLNLNTYTILLSLLFFQNDSWTPLPCSTPLRLVYHTSLTSIFLLFLSGKILLWSLSGVCRKVYCWSWFCHWLCEPEQLHSVLVKLYV